MQRLSLSVKRLLRRIRDFYIWQKLLEKRRDWLAARGIQYLFIVAPDKHDIYPEMLPGWLQAAAPAGRETKLDQFLSYMKEHSTVPVLDLRPPLVAAKKIAPTYLQNDTHWNSFGGFVAGQEVVKFLGEKIPGLPPLRLEDFTWTNAPFTGGDVARQAGREPAEKNYFVFSPKPGVASPKLHTDTRIVSTWGPRNEAVISEGAAPLTVGAVIFHDSFAAPWVQFFGHSFQRVVFLNEKREFNTQLITDSHPQVVITEMLERFFNTYEPAEFLARDALP